MALPVSQGDAFFLKSPDGSVLVDGGRSVEGFPELFVRITGQSEVESMLSTRYVLMAAENLPPGFPPGGGAVGGGHMWLVVGYSDYGPMIVSWGQEFQISWAQFNSWTTGVWSIGATSP